MIGSITRQTRAGSGRWLALGAIVLSSLVLGLDSTIVVTALPTLSSKLAATTDQLQWISAGYLLGLAGFLIPAGVLGDRMGRRRMLLISLLTFGASSMAASQMTGATGLIWMRAVMGISGAFIFPISLAVLPTIFEAKERPRAVAIGGAGMFLGLPLGPLMAGWLLTHYHWGSIFLINGPIVVMAMIGVWLFIPESRDTGARKLDFVGAGLAISGVTSLVYGVIEQPAFGWGDATVVVSLSAGAILICGFIFWQLRAPAPLVDLRLLSNPRFSWSILVSAVMSFALMGTLFVLTPFLQIVQANDAQATGLRLLPLIGGIVLGAALSDRLVKRLGVRAMLGLGLLICGSGLVLMSVVGPASAYGLLALALPVIGVGNAFAMFTSINVILDVLPESQTGAGTALTRSIGQIGSSFGVALMGSLLNSVYRDDLTINLPGLPVGLRNAAEGSVAAASLLAAHLPAPIASSLIHAAATAYTTGMSEGLRASAAVMVVTALLVTVLMPEPRKAVPQRIRGEARPQDRLPVASHRPKLLRQPAGNDIYKDEASFVAVLDKRRPG